MTASPTARWGTAANGPGGARRGARRAAPMGAPITVRGLPAAHHLSPDGRGLPEGFYLGMILSWAYLACPPFGIDRGCSCRKDGIAAGRLHFYRNDYTKESYNVNMNYL